MIKITGTEQDIEDQSGSYNFENEYGNRRFDPPELNIDAIAADRGISPQTYDYTVSGYQV